MKFILNIDGKPIGDILDNFWRVEFQQRGSPHIHSLWWVKDAPNLRTVEIKRATPEFIDKYIICSVPVIGEDDELRSLVMRVQRHTFIPKYAENKVASDVDLISQRERVQLLT